jgi:drug/metabolite transporter (DMT)-like permease
MVVLLSLGAALGYAISSVLQQRAAASQPAGYAMRATLIVRLLRRPLWLAGKAVDIVATILQAIAIHLGSLIVVEPLLASGLLFALPLGAAVAGTRLGRQDWQGALALTAGLAVFTVAAPDTGGRAAAPIGTWCVLGVVVAVAGWALVTLAHRGLKRHRAALLATVGGLLYACTAALTKPVTKAWTAGLSRLVTTWELYALLAVSLVAVVLVQTAFQIGSVASSLPALSAVEPVAGAAIGVAVFREHLTSSPAGMAPLVIGLIAALAGIICLARSPLAALAGDIEMDRQVGGGLADIDLIAAGDGLEASEESLE